MSQSTTPHIACTFESTGTDGVVVRCKKHLPAEHMWLPEWKARQNANGGKKVFTEDFPKFALCGRHGHLLREAGVRVYRFAEEVKREESRKADLLSFQPFADRFTGKVKPGPNAGRQPRRPQVGADIVGGGLSRLAKEDAVKRTSETKQAEKPATNGAAAPAEPVATTPAS